MDPQFFFGGEERSDEITFFFLRPPAVVHEEELTWPPPPRFGLHSDDAGDLQLTLLRKEESAEHYAEKRTSLATCNVLIGSFIQAHMYFEIAGDRR